MTNLNGLIFYLTAAVILAGTSMAVTRRNPVHAVVYLVISFLGSAVLFYQLGAPLLAALEVIIYAGAIMVLFLFVIMMLKPGEAEPAGFSLRRWTPALVLALLFVAVSGLTVFRNPGSRAFLHTAMVAPRRFGRYIFEQYWLAVEIMSLLLLVGLLAAVQLGRGKTEAEESEDGVATGGTSSTPTKGGNER